MSPFDDISAVVLGAGSIGRRHIKNLKDLGVGRITAIDPDPERLRPVVEEHGVSAAVSWEEAVTGNVQPDVAVICTPPSLHAEQCAQAATCGVDVFVEKPLATTLEEIDRVQALSREHDCIVQVGYNLRFIPGMQTLKSFVDRGDLGKPLWARFEFGQYLPDWRPWQDYRESYTARKELGGGIILDGSHEIDLALWLLGKPEALVCLAGKVSELEMDVEDCATILVRFEGGARADVHLDCIQREYSRGLKVAFQRGTASWSWPENILRVFEVDRGERLHRPPEGYVPNEMYLDEMRHFLCSVLDGVQTNSLQEGREVVRVALAALSSAEEQKWVDL